MRNLISISATLCVLAACTLAGWDGLKKSDDYAWRAELVTCQNQDAGWAEACRNVQQHTTAKLGGL